MRLSTTPEIDGHRVSKTLGIVHGISAKSRNIIMDTWAQIKSLFGGEVRPYTKLIEDIKEAAIKKLEESARNMGADGVVNVRFETVSTGSSNDAVSVHATGTAVKLAA